MNPEELVNEYSLSNLVDSIKYIKLVTDDDLPIGEIKKIGFHKNRIYVADFDNSLFCFERNGTLIYHIYEVGKGVGEYRELVDFTIDRDKNELIITDDYGLSFYNLNDGSFVRKVKTPSPSYRMEYLGDGKLIFDTGMNTDLSAKTDGNLYKILITDMDGNIVERYFPFDVNLYSSGSIYYKTPQFFYSDKSILVNPIFENRVFVFGGTMPKEVYYIDFGSKRIKEELLKRENFRSLMNTLSDYALVADLIQCGDHKLVYYTYHDKPFVSVFSNDGSAGKSFEFSNLVNDLDRVPVAPFQANTIGGVLVGILYPNQLIESRAHASDEDQVLLNLTTDMNEFDNPVIALYYAN